MAAASTNNARPRTATSRGHGVMGLIMMAVAPSTPAAKAAAVPLGRLLTPWGSHRGAYDVNRLVNCAERAVVIRIGDARRRRTLVACRR